MRASPRSGTKRQTLNIRIQRNFRNSIDRAAALVGKKRTDFVLNAPAVAMKEIQDTGRSFVSMKRAASADMELCRRA